MKLTVIGRWGAFPAAGEATASYLLEAGGQKLLLDCGSGALSVLQRFAPISELSAVFISHQHYDHMADLGCLQYACLIDTDLERRDQPLRLFIPGEAESSWPVPVMKGTSSSRIHENARISLDGGIELSFFRTNHGAYCLGMRIEAEGKVLVYTADTRYDESLVPYMLDADLLITECSFYANFNASQYGHMNAHEAGKLAAKAGARSLLLSHLPHFGDVQVLKEEAAAFFTGEIQVAALGLEVEI
ncbi:MAG: fold metallo-hydrolase [Paenibacillaceae bacterium]|jgi:ribonuclease BN (tRNA processing enzyme)|nr:fold metallo-hydrolase [Paenibacillaceae bacterium]